MSMARPRSKPVEQLTNDEALRKLFPRQVAQKAKREAKKSLRPQDRKNVLAKKAAVDADIEHGRGAVPGRLDFPWLVLVGPQDDGERLADFPFIGAAHWARLV